MSERKLFRHGFCFSNKYTNRLGTVFANAKSIPKVQKANPTKMIGKESIF